jgi:hypothetical protein
MRYPTAAAFRRALEDRLSQRARTTGEPLMRLRKNVVFQRLLAGLLVVSPDRWILKGALALDFRRSHRRGARPRATKDMDPAYLGDIKAADADFRRIQDLDLSDYFGFTVERTEVAHEDQEAGGAGLRYRVRATLAGRVFEQVLVDVGFAPPTAQPEVVEGPDLLDEPSEQVGIASALEDGYQQAGAFLNPILRGTASGGARWEPTTQRWG